MSEYDIAFSLQKIDTFWIWRCNADYDVNGCCRDTALRVRIIPAVAVKIGYF
ncbi:hypothetical protein [Paenibacillus sp. Z6-24]